MAQPDIVITGGEVVTPAGIERADVAIRGERIAAILPAGTADAAAETIDADGLLVLPGAIDPHTHIRWPLGNGETTEETVAGATEAAVVAGITTVVDFAPLERGEDVVAALDRRIAEFDGHAACDFAFHSIVSDASPRTLSAVPELVERGVASFKLYTTFDDRRIDDGEFWLLLRAIGEHGGIAAIHAENDEIVRHATERLRAEGREAIADFPDARPAVSEAEAISMVLTIAEAVDAPLYILHLTCGQGLALIRDARARGVLVATETCPHYLAFDDSVYDAPDSWRYVITPTIRGIADQAILWDALASGEINAVSSDHCAYGVAQKDLGPTFAPIPFGAPGIEERVPFLLDRGLREGRLALERLVDACSTAPARIMGLYPRKGVIAEGSDADLVLVDPEAPWSFSDASVASAYTLYGGATGAGRAVTTLLRGQVMARDGRFVGPQATGRFQRRRLDRGHLSDAIATGQPLPT
jgi:dihydropyrimidinase